MKRVKGQFVDLAGVLVESCELYAGFMDVVYDDFAVGGSGGHVVFILPVRPLDIMKVERLSVHIGILAIFRDGSQEVVFFNAGIAVDTKGAEDLFAGDDGMRPIAVDIKRRNLIAVRGLQAGILGRQWVYSAAAELAGVHGMARGSCSSCN